MAVIREYGGRNLFEVEGGGRTALIFVALAHFA